MNEYSTMCSKYCFIVSLLVDKTLCYDAQPHISINWTFLHLFMCLFWLLWLTLGTSLLVPWLRLCAPNAGVLGSLLGQGIRSHMPHESVSRSVLSSSLGSPWTVTHHAPLSMEVSRQEDWSGLPFPSPGDLPNPGIEPGSHVLQGDS